jgi:hypothetical protein
LDCSTPSVIQSKIKEDQRVRVVEWERMEGRAARESGKGLIDVLYIKYYCTRIYVEPPPPLITPLSMRDDPKRWLL